MFILINTFDRWRVMSRHFTREAAERENRQVQRAVKRYNGRDSYLPTTIRHMNPAPKKGEFLNQGEDE